MKVLLVSTNRLTVPFAVYPLGLDHVAGAIADRHQVQLLDLGADRRPDALPNALRELRPDVVGISMRNVDNTDVAMPVAFLDDVRAAVDAVRRNSSARIVLGGSGFGIFPAEILAAVDADCGIVGEGERLGLLLDAWKRGADIAQVPGVVVRDGPVVRPEPWDGPRPRALPPAGATVEHYLRGGGMLNLQTKRGCPHACTYCTYPLLEGHRLRPFPPPEVARTARALQDAGARFLFFADSTFNVDPEHNLAVAEAMRGAGVTVPWSAFFAPSAPPPDYYRRLAACGLTHVEFGTESLSAPMLAAYGKWFTPDDVRAAHDAALAAGLHVAHYFLLGGPGETDSTLAETLEGADRLPRCVRFFFASVRIYPGTPLHALAVGQGAIPADRSLLEPCFYRGTLAAVEILRRTRERARGRLDWIVGSADERLTKLATRLYARGATGPLWERLIG
jgi:radical SAM superfamily enzyme YgiQ (UPF0313 family)